MENKMQEIVKSFLNLKNFFQKNKLETLAYWYEQIPKHAWNLPDDEYNMMVDLIAWKETYRQYGVERKVVEQFLNNQL